MGGAFVAVADDATAVYWNPAGLFTGDLLSVVLDRSEAAHRSAGGIPAADRSGLISALSTTDVAFAYYRQELEPARAAPGGAALRLQHAALASAQPLAPGVSVGTTLRYVRGHASLLGAATAGAPPQASLPVSTRGRGTFDLDLGLLAGNDTIRVGVVARNLRQPSFETPDGGAIDLERQVRAGVSVRTVADLLVAVDADLRAYTDAIDGQRRNVALGAEYWFGQWLGVRGGVRANLEAEDPRLIHAVGISLAVASGLFLDGQITRSGADVERGWSVAARVGF